MARRTPVLGWFRLALPVGVIALALATLGVAGAATAAGTRHVREAEPAHAPAPPSRLLLPTKAAAPGGSSVTMISESGDWVGAGTSRLWRTSRDSITTGGAKGSLAVSVSGGAGDFTLEFAAPNGKTLEPGSYGGAERWPFESAGRPGLDVSGDGRGCNEVSGRFWVLDINPRRTRVWVVYEEHCEGGRPAVFGEIRIGEPAGGAASLMPTRVSWPDDYPHVDLRPVPVYVLNRHAAPLTVTGAQIVAGGSDFSVKSNTCSGALAQGDDCAIYVGFTPSIRGSRIGELRLDTSDGTRWVPLSGAGLTGRTFFEMHSQPGDYIGGGQSYSYTPQTGADIEVGGNESVASAAITSGDHWWYADFEADSGSLLLPGATFPDATRYPFNGTGAGLSIDGDGRGCNELTGSFSVEHSSFNDSGTLTSLLVDFEQWCDNSSGALTGTLGWRAPDESAPPRDQAAPHAVSDVHHRWSGERLEIGWRNPGDTDWADTVVRVLPDTTAPSSPGRGREVYTGRGTHATVRLSAGHQHYAVSVFSRDSSGNWKRVSFTVRHPS